VRSDPRGSRFAGGKEPSRDAQGHSLPSDVFAVQSGQPQDRLATGMSGMLPSAADEPRAHGDDHDDQALQATVTEWWESEPSHQRGMEIASDVKMGTGRYRSLIEPVRCRNCTARGKTARMVLAVYAGPDGSIWLWTPGYQGLVNNPEARDGEIHTQRIPPSARPFVLGLFGVGVCSNCRHGQPFFVEPDGIINTNFEPHAPTFGRVTEG
jgi:hypothetical protein